MARQAASGVLLVLLLAVSGSASEDVERQPRLELRVSPRVSVARPPVPVMVSAVLLGGEDLEQYYCAGIEWDWGDGSRSARQSDCAPFRAGVSIQRYFTATHVYREQGQFEVRVRLLRGDAAIAAARSSFTLRATAMASW